MEAFTVALKIEQRIKLIAKKRVEIEPAAIKKAEAVSAYDKAVALTIMRLKNGQPVELDGVGIISPPATVLDKIARGVCWRERLEADKAEGLYKAVVSELNAIEAELNGYQSIYRHLDET